MSDENGSKSDETLPDKIRALIAKGDESIPSALVKELLEEDAALEKEITNAGIVLEAQAAALRPLHKALTPPKVMTLDQWIPWAADEIRKMRLAPVFILRDTTQGFNSVLGVFHSEDDARRHAQIAPQFKEKGDQLQIELWRPGKDSVQAVFGFERLTHFKFVEKVGEAKEGSASPSEN